MNKFNIIIFIIVFLFKTGNVFFSSFDFNVNNIIVSGNINSNITKEKLLNDAFQKGFDKFINMHVFTAENTVDICNRNFDVFCFR